MLLLAEELQPERISRKADARSALSSASCSDPENQKLEHNAPTFFHYGTDVESTDAVCDVLEGFSTSDELADDSRRWSPIAPNGYQDFLRPEAFKSFVVITDDDMFCSYNGDNFRDNNSASGGQTAADLFDDRLLALSPIQFGTAAARTYAWHSIVAMAENSPPEDAWPATEPINTGTCTPGSEGPGTGYQALSIKTGGLRYPTCRNSDFNVIFNAIAEEVILSSGVSCEIALPNEGDFDPDGATVQYLPAGDPPATMLNRAIDAADCGNVTGGWYYDDNSNPTELILCTTTCDLINADPAARISIDVGCLPPANSDAGGAPIQLFDPSVEREIYEGTCPEGKPPQWGFLTWESTAIGGSSIAFFGRSASSEAGLESEPWIELGTSEASPIDTQTCTYSGPSPCPIELAPQLGFP